MYLPTFLFFFFFNDTATTEIYTLSLHDALPISRRRRDAAGGRALARPEGAHGRRPPPRPGAPGPGPARPDVGDRKSTRLNSRHSQISDAVFCLKKKKKAAHTENKSILSSAFTRQ